MPQDLPKWGTKSLLLVNLGTPRELSVRAVREYLAEFLMDRRVIQAPWLVRALFVHGIILALKQRQRSSYAAYAKIWTKEGSPLMIYSERLAAKVRDELKAEGMQVELAMRYGQPSIKAKLTRLVENGAREIRVLPLYPQWSEAASASVLDEVEAWLARQNKEFRSKLKVEVKLDFFAEPEFVQLLSKKITGALSAAGGATPGQDTLLMTYHGLPEGQHPCLTRSPYGGCCTRFGKKNRYCYRAQCFETTRLVTEALRSMIGTLPEIKTTFQSRLGPTQWIKPYTDIEVEQMKKERASHPRRLTVISPSFVADCLETLEELGIRLREQWGETMTLAECLNDDSEWAKAVAKFAIEPRDWISIQEWKTAVYG